MNLIKALFNGLSLRERFLLLAFLWVGLLLWAGGLINHYQDERERFHRVGVDLERQAHWFEEKEHIDERLWSALERLDPARTYNSTQLSGRLDSIARETSLSFDISSPSTQESDIFSIHSVRIQVRRAKIDDLIAFDAAVKQEFPYLGLEGFQINAPSRDPRQLDAVFQIFSFELKPEQF